MLMLCPCYALPYIMLHYAILCYVMYCLAAAYSGKTGLVLQNLLFWCGSAILMLFDR